MDMLYAGPEDAAATVLLAPGAGGGADSPWMNQFCDLLAAKSVRTVRFEFGYTAGRKEGIRRAQPKAEAVTSEYLTAVRHVSPGAESLFIGGKSFGGRVATLVGQQLHDAGSIAGLVCLGYPFHPPGRPEQLRTAHLLNITVPTLICQGERDDFGRAHEVAGYGLPGSIRVHWLPDGDHGFRPRNASGRTIMQNHTEAADAVAEFVLGV